MAANLAECSAYKQMSVIKFLCKLCGIYSRMYDVYGEACLIQKVKENELNTSLPLVAMEWKYSDSPVDKKFWAQWSVEKIMLGLLRHQRNQHY